MLFVFMLTRHDGFENESRSNDFVAAVGESAFVSCHRSLSGGTPADYFSEHSVSTGSSADGDYMGSFSSGRRTESDASRSSGAR